MEDSMFQQEAAKGTRSAPAAAPKQAGTNVDDDFPIVSMEDSMFQQETAKGMQSAPEAAPKKASANVDDDFPIVSVSLLIILTSWVVTFLKYEGYYFLILECYTEEISIEDHTLGCYLYFK